jgi:hypothetical protein
VHFRLRSVAALAGTAACVLGASACTAHSGPSAAERSASAASASAREAREALSQLQRQTSSGINLSFTATYRAEETNPARSGTIHVFHTPSAARIDVDEAGATVRILVNDKGTFSCKFATGSKPPLCVTLAAHGEQVPASLDPGLQHMFTADLGDLVDNTVVHAAPSPSGVTASAAAGAACFAVSSLPAGSDLSAGTYCFANGLLVSAQFRTSSLQLTAAGRSPASSDFTLPASPAPLSSGTPSAATASPSAASS